jgi:hypothetical protein
LSTLLDVGKDYSIQGLNDEGRADEG